MFSPSAVSRDLETKLDFVDGDTPLHIAIEFMVPGQPEDPATGPPTGGLIETLQRQEKAAELIRLGNLNETSRRQQIEETLQQQVIAVIDSIEQAGGQAEPFNWLNQTLSCKLPARWVPHLAQLPGVKTLRLHESVPKTERLRQADGASEINALHRWGA